ncbi:hypothetical protein EAF00_004759 [Botryotinia globosa]|nr:hypothetical protein EAF00_004759 [Botryotinia globosa]
MEKIRSSCKAQDASNLRCLVRLSAVSLPRRSALFAIQDSSGVQCRCRVHYSVFTKAFVPSYPVPTTRE